MPVHPRKLCIVLAASLWTLATLPASAADEKRPNVVVILTDDQRWDQLGIEGHPFLQTPSIDRIAKQGVRFSNAFVTTSLCSPSRASFLSGRYPHGHGVRNNFTDYPRDLPSYVSRLKEIGYATAYIGKWHMGEEDASPRPHFDYWASHSGQGDYFDTTFNVNGQTREIEGYYTTVVTDMAVEQLRKFAADDRPFCLILGHKAPHTPYVPERRYSEVFNQIDIDYPHSAYLLGGKPDWIKDRLDTWHGIYGPLYGFRQDFPNRSAAAVIDFQRFVQSIHETLLSVDDSVGRVDEILHQTGAAENTLFVFASDNGCLLGEHGMTDKRTMHEPSIRIPLLMRYPGLIRPGSVIPQLVLNQDLAPTIVELCGGKSLGDIDGQSLLPLFRGDTKGWRTSFLYEYNYEKQFPYTPNVRGVRTPEWKFVRYPHGDGSPDRHRPEMYDLASDPEERSNLADDPQFAARRSELEAELFKYWQPGAAADDMPLDEGIQSTLPDASIR